MIQARCSSTRLPNKVLMDLCGKTVLQRMIERVQRSKMADEVMVVTSIEKENLPIIKLCTEMGVRVGVGSEEDVLDRYYQTAKLLKPKYVIRLTADCPCFDSELLDEALRQMKEDTDYLGMISQTFADGLDIQIISFKALEKSWNEAIHSFEREHVTQYVIRRPNIFNIQDFVSPIGDFGNQRWTVDEPEDYEVVKHIFSHFINEVGTEYFGYKDIVEYMNMHPEVREMNKKYQRDEGLTKSMQEDRIVK
jgi:spore coat polysaccharide biosynthesis protein SpsF (cytidylyltransferase family)